MAGNFIPSALRGQSPITLDGKVYMLKYTFGAMAELCAYFKVKSVAAIFADPGSWSPEEIMTIVLVGLRASKSWPDCTLEDLQDKMLFSELADYMQAISVAFGIASNGPAGKKDSSVALGNAEDQEVAGADPF